MQKPLIQYPPLLSTTEAVPQVESATNSPETNEVIDWKQSLKTDRIATHLVLLALIIMMGVLGGFKLTTHQQLTPTFTRARPAALPQPLNNIKQPQIAQPLALSGILENKNTGLLLSAPVPHITIPERVIEEQKITEITTYKVQAGDTISDIAAKFGIKPETLLWANSELENNPDLLSIDQVLTILPIDGVYHQVGGSDTIDGIATVYKTDPQAIIDSPLNNLNLENPIIKPGQWLVVPDGTKPYIPKYVSVAAVSAPSGSLGGTGAFSWPTSGSITQQYWNGHRGLDIGAWTGAPIYAADSGYVVAAQWDDRGYGRMVIVDHGNGFKSLYAHLSVIYVSVGEEVAQGQQIGEMGSTGNSTGPHLHFELILNGAQRNPWGFLP